MTEIIWSKFTSIRRIDGKNKEVIVDICGDIINRNPTKEELRGLKKHLSIREILKLPEEETKKYLLEFLRYFYEKEGRAPIYKDFENNSKYPSDSTYQKIFGSWINAIIEAGLLDKRDLIRYTDEELLEYLRKFYRENNRPPTTRDFTNNPNYPHYDTYKDRFGSWEEALRLVGLDTDSMVVNGIVQTENQKGRLAEIFVREHFDDIENVVDLSGKNCNSPYDGICPTGKIYDVKSSKLGNDRDCWNFHILNVSKEEIEWYYLLAFNEDYSELLRAWRIPAWDFMESIGKCRILIGINNNYRYNIENMKQYEITDRLLPVFKNRQIKFNVK